MLVKVALRNIRRSVKDYAIYFVTLLMAVTLFYAFNSISEQHVMTEINESSHIALDQATQARIRHVFHVGHETDPSLAHHRL